MEEPRARDNQQELEARVAELLRANALLEEADQRKDEFLAVLAHELRNPLAALSSAVELMRVADADPETHNRVVGVLERQVRQLSHLVDDLLDVARIVRGKIHLEKQQVDLKTIVNRALETARPLLDAKAHQRHVSLPSMVLPVEADPERLTQVFVNLLSNAAKFTRERGNVWITAEPALAEPDAGEGSTEQPLKPGVVVRIRDDGMGMDKELLPRVFDLFVQASTGTDRATGGLGVGLALVRRLVRLHGGHVSAHSDGPGQGSEFVVQLPLIASVPVATVPAHPSAKHADSPPGHRILIVDDNIDTADSLAKLLRYLGQDVCTAHESSGALDLVRTFQPEIILLDIGLPGLNGFEVASLIRQQPGMKNARLVAVTGYTQEDNGVHSKEAGFDQYLVKPVGLKTLDKLLRES